MRFRQLHPWDLSPREAVQVQRRLAGLVRTSGRLGRVRHVAGADISWEREGGPGFAAVIVFRWPGLEEVERATAAGPAAFPYVPGLLSFREGPLLLEAFSRLRTVPDLVFFDGQGIAHPRRFGIASHLGLLLDTPSIGCAKSLLIGAHAEPAPGRGSTAPLFDGRERIGMAVRTRDGVRPVYVSVGHGIGLAAAVRWTLACGDGCRVPRPTRLADQVVGALRRGRPLENPHGGFS